ncbi:MAG: glycosyltransferase family 2 protein [Armatimonadota bacterium]|nr:glycosyltransferase family 2 protein [Armatimonadota bacterium]
MPPLSVIVITRDAARHIAEALASVTWADEIVVVDSGSTDDTVEIVRHYTDRVVTHPWLGYGAQKNYATSLARHDWILSLDADERVPPALAEEIRELLRGEPPCRGYRIPRVTWHLGRWIRSTDWYPDFQLRLYDRRSARWATRRVHESVQVDGPVGYLRHELHHYPYCNLADHLATMDRYSRLAAQDLLEQGRRARLWDVALHPPAAFLRNYLLRGGFRDGLPGLIISAMNAYYVFLKFAKLWELQQAPRAE